MASLGTRIFVTEPGHRAAGLCGAEWGVRLPSLLPWLSQAFAEGAPDRLAFLRLPPGPCQVGLVFAEQKNEQ